MHIVVAVRQVPDLAEGLEIDESGTRLDTSWIKFRLNEFDEHALEQALLLKERHGATVTVVTPDIGDPDESLFTCIAKGADRAVKVQADGEGLSARRAAAVMAPVIRALQPTLVLTGVQAIDDLEGQLAPFLAQHLELPWVTVVTGVSVDGNRACVRKEYPGGVVAEMEVDLPAVFGIQAAEQPPRYAAISKIRQAMKSAQLALEAGGEIPAPLVEVRRLAKPEATSRARMLEGSPDEVAAEIVRVLVEHGVLKG